MPRPPIAFVNGDFVPENWAVVSVFDRSFCYGDGVFETLRVYRGQPFAWEDHLQRFAAGASLLSIRQPLTHRRLQGAATELLRQNARTDAVLRLHLSRGAGPRGYSPRHARTPTLIMTIAPAPDCGPHAPARLRLIVSRVCLLSSDVSGACKTANRLPQILARREAEVAGADEALLLNERQELVSASSGNAFWIRGDVVGTPPLSSGALPGITRHRLLTLCQRHGIRTEERPFPAATLRRHRGALFLTSSVREIARVVRLGDRCLPSSPLIERLHLWYREEVDAECRG